jgi:hypothetical protein
MSTIFLNDFVYNIYMKIIRKRFSFDVLKKENLHEAIQ